MVSINTIRRQLKRKAKQTLNPHFKFFAAMILPWFIAAVLANVNENISLEQTNDYLFKGDFVTFFIGIIAYLLMVSFSFTSLDLIRGHGTFKSGIASSTTIFRNGNYFIGSIMVTILKFIWIFLWSLLLIFPGYIKQLAYSQALFIYKDAVDQGQHIKYRDAITRSRHLMRGHKWELFVIQLSFIGWWLLSICTLHLADFWTTPYYQLTLVNFYQKLIDH